MTPLKAVTLDCWQTLMVQQDGHLARGERVDALVDAAATAGKALPRGDAASLLDRAWAYHTAGWRAGEAINSPEMTAFALGELGIDDESVRDELEHRWRRGVFKGTTVAIPGAQDALVCLRDAGLKLSLICDTGTSGGAEVRELLDRNGLLCLLDHCVFSDEARAPKPNAVVFETALHALEADASEAVHVGDLDRTDIAGAKAMGMRAIRFTGIFDDPEATVEPDLISSSWPDVTDWILQRAGLAGGTR